MADDLEDGRRGMMRIRNADGTTRMASVSVTTDSGKIRVIKPNMECVSIDCTGPNIENGELLQALQNNVSHFKELLSIAAYHKHRDAGLTSGFPSVGIYCG